MTPGFLYMVCLIVLLVTCVPLANAAISNGRVHRHLRHQLVARVVRHASASSSHHEEGLEKDEEDSSAAPSPADPLEDDPKPCTYGDRTVNSGWRGPGFGDNNCNNCTCDNEVLVCTKQECVVDDDFDDDDDDTTDDVDEPTDAEKKELQLAVTKAREALNENLEKQGRFLKEKALLENLSESDKQIDAKVHRVANETESVAMADMLGDMWKEVRMFAAPEYIQYLKEEILKLQDKQKVLEQKLSDAQAALVEGDPRIPASIKQAEAPALEVNLPTRTFAPMAAPPGASEEDEKAEDPNQTKKTWQPWWMEQKQRKTALISGSVYIVFGVVFAYIYYQARKRRDFLKMEISPRPGQWSVGIFGCWGSSMKMCLLGFCCPCVRWADTVDRAQLGLSYWAAFFLMLILLVLDPYSYGVTGLMVVILGVIFRQRLRHKYGLPRGKGRECAEDILVWCCCTPCAIIQEAHEEVANRAK